ncbi:hypothetical protein [Streptomyces huiliensis]|uniref:hypothetical protein n=1 Tax=Streptomyces huiliensis TaxID=2876027 RepID=UPI001CC0B7A4|nr:hypothetical protein [Streptomyces huiliensis]MBZ4320158.1 hypothetical protein [Streptomyces huiliensis]
MNRHTTRAILAVTATAAVLTIAAPASATSSVSTRGHETRTTVREHEDLIEALRKKVGATAEEIKLVKDKILSQNNGDEDAEERGIIGMALDLLTGTTPEASPSPGGLVVHTGSGGQFHQAYPGTVPGYGGFGGFGGGSYF